MKTIEERAKAFCEAKICPECSGHKTCDRKCLTKCVPTDDPYDLLVEFAKAEHAEASAKLKGGPARIIDMFEEIRAAGVYRGISYNATAVEFFATAGAMIAAEIDRLNNVKQE